MPVTRPGGGLGTVTAAAAWRQPSLTNMPHWHPVFSGNLPVNLTKPVTHRPGQSHGELEHCCCQGRDRVFANLQMNIGTGELSLTERRVRDWQHWAITCHKTRT